MVGVKGRVLLLLVTLIFSQTAWSVDCVQALVGFKDTLTVKFLETKYSNHPVVSTIYDIKGLDAPRVLLDVWNLDNKNFPLSTFGVAASIGDVDLVRELLKVKGINSEYRNDAEETTLMLAAKNGHVDVVGELIAVRKINVDAKDKMDNTVLMLAAQNGHVGVIRVLLDNFNINLNARNLYGRTALMLAAENGHMDVIRELLAFAASTHINILHVVDNTGNYALMLAAQNGHDDAVETLLDASDDIDVNSKNLKHQTALLLAAKNGHVDVVASLLGVKNIDVNTGGSIILSTPLIAASRNGHLEVIKLLLSYTGIEVNATNQLGETALVVAARNKRAYVIEQLLQVDGVDGVGGIDVNAQDIFNMPALTLLIKDSGPLEVRASSQWVIPMFLKHPDIDVNLASFDKTTPLIMAAREMVPYAVELLLAHPRIKPKLRDNKGLSALLTAQEHICCAVWDRYPGSMIKSFMDKQRIIRMLRKKIRQFDSSIQEEVSPSPI